MVTKQKATKDGKTDKTVGPVTTSDIAQTAPKGPEPGAAPAAKGKKEDQPQDIEVTASEPELAARDAEKAANEEKDERRAEVRSLEEKYGAVPSPVVPQGPSAQRDWQVSNTLSPEETDMLVRQGEIKREIRKEARR